MKHVHHDMIVEWAKDTSRTIQWCSGGCNWIDVQGDPQWSPYAKYRFKPEEPKFIVVNGVNVPEPVRGGLSMGTTYYLADPTCNLDYATTWTGHTMDNRWLSRGLIHLTREAAQAHIDAVLPSRTDK